MERIKTGIIGCGKVAHMHAKALKNVPESMFTAVCNRNIVKAKAFADLYNVKAYASIEEIVSDGGVGGGHYRNSTSGSCRARSSCSKSRGTHTR